MLAPKELHAERCHAVYRRLLPTFAGVLRGENRTRASFSKILANQASEESLINAVHDKKYNLSELSFKEVSGVSMA